jgi:hypothetical protein
MKKLTKKERNIMRLAFSEFLIKVRRNNRIAGESGFDVEPVFKLTKKLGFRFTDKWYLAH